MASGLAEAASSHGHYPAWVTYTQDIAYLVAALLFAYGIKRLGSPRTARSGNGIAAIGMLIAIVVTLYTQEVMSFTWIIAAMVIGSAIGATFSIRVQMTGMPQMVGLFNGFGGIASILVVTSEYMRLAKADLLTTITPDQGLTMGLGILIGGVTFIGSLIAAGKLQGILPGRPMMWPMQLPLNVLGVALCLAGCVTLAINPALWWVVVGLWVISFILGITLLVPIGGADMPVGICLLNSYSGLAAAMTGFILPEPNKALMVSGALVGASGLILTYIMCKAMNRSLANVLFAGVGTDDSTGTAGRDAGGDKTVRSVDPEEMAMILEDSAKVVIVPGYGMAVAQAQYAVRDMFNKLEGKEIEVLFGIHPVAGRMPGHMNVLLAEVDIPYDKLLDLDQINAELETADLALVLGANDVVNPAARHDKGSPIYGMPIIDVDKARTCVVCKRSLAAGYAGVQNELFFMDNTLMLFGDAKKMITEVTAAIES
ncbi:MAG: NAD(P)(+) transhydrogenase (Re/Si-specific) subunit beta [Planctomycetes bacterium]|nr:NAD(P)(+) transhydrogenase (Re/Si-specific) subunit beta [Planctomycetota bacterium]NOG55299.1 NAD(P)(+) transhydrogenase (Re/Si-specific) subunit beta [Planctomycetota bacterium]